MGALKGKHVVVVGGSRGVGRVIVEAAIAAGARVLAVARGQHWSECSVNSRFIPAKLAAPTG
ncbi:MAG: hypothetical protein KME03_06355 [Aphanocapsa lilacina HA4352-LM1]|jgi:NAD(P)-dependent dehydrogenase (short-subunit alcohol dehydrogenase family)|nr:hypothetical protein [Aphanocapsa lilacina HA4352-LM1]